MTTTTKLGATKPGTSDTVDVTVIDAAFDLFDNAAGATLCTNATRPSAPFQGQTIRETDTHNVLIRNGAAWEPIGSVVTTAGRPSAVTAGVGCQLYDSTLGIPIWSNGTTWRNAAGSAV